MIEIEVGCPGVIGPGLESWHWAAAVLRNEVPHVATDCVPLTPAVLDPRERRRAPPAVRLALVAAEEARLASGIPANEYSTVFASSLGNGSLLNSILLAIADPERKVSPTQFHNSVHNAAAGYWTIGTGNRMPCTSIAAHNHTFAMGLLKAAAQATLESGPILLTVFDHPFPEPLDRARDLGAPFAAAFVLGRLLPKQTRMGKLTLQPARWAPPSVPRTGSLRELWRANPAARSLVLLEALASRAPATIVVDAGAGTCITITYAPC